MAEHKHTVTITMHDDGFFYHMTGDGIPEQEPCTGKLAADGESLNIHFPNGYVLNVNDGSKRSVTVRIESRN